MEYGFGCFLLVFVLQGIRTSASVQFYEGLKKQFPEHLLRISGKAIPLKDAENKYDAGKHILSFKKYGSEIADCMQSKGEPQLHADWWKAFRS